MSANAIVSAANDRRIRRARASLEGRSAGEEVLIVGATPDAANELARSVATTKGAAFGLHRLTLSRLAFAVAAPVLAARGLTPLSRIGADTIAARLAHRMERRGQAQPLSISRRYAWIPRAIAGVITEFRLAEVDARPNATVEVLPAPGEGRECFEITRRVLSLARGGIPFDRIAVLLRSPVG
jgi:ATP-dependent helicase/nuclease subunit B